MFPSPIVPVTETVPGSMQSQMEAKLASIKSPGLKSGLPHSPTARNFSANRQSLALDNSSNYLSPDSAVSPSGSDAAATLAQRRAELKASNAAHRISAPVLASAGADGRTSWSTPQLTQVTEQSGTVQEAVGSARPKSTEFSGTLGSPRAIETTVPSGDSWASMVNTPLVPMFQKDARLPSQNLDAAATKLNEWTKPGASNVPRMGDPTVHRRKPLSDGNQSNIDDNTPSNQNRGAPGGMRNASGGWSGMRNMAPSNASPNRFGGNDDISGGPNAMNGLGMQMGAGGINMGMGSPGMGMGMNGMGGMQPLSPYMNMLGTMGLSMTPEMLLAAQMAASGFGQNAAWLGMQPISPASQNNRRGPSSGRSAGLKSASSTGSRGDGGTPKMEDDVDPALLNDVGAWLRSLRLHKYSPNFEGMKWQDMVSLDEAQLEAKGVAALGARRKMLKTFELVRKKMGMEGGAATTPTKAT